MLHALSPSLMLAALTWGQWLLQQGCPAMRHGSHRKALPCLHRYMSAFLTTPGAVNPNHVLYEIAVLDQVRG